VLLKALYDLAHSRKLLDDLAFTKKPIRWVISLDAEGNLLGFTSTGDDKRGKEFSVPQTSRAKNAGGVAEFLADGLTAVFGFDTDPDKDKDNEKRRHDRDKNNAEKHRDFWQQIQVAFEKTKHPALQALLNFQQKHLANIDSLKWKAREGQKPAWWLKTAAGNEVKLGAENFTFEVADKLLIEDEATLRPYWRKVYQQELSDKTEAVTKGLCLITGETEVPIAPTHNPKIKGVPNAQPTGAAIVSFDKPAFASYGCDQSYNAPASIEASTAYCVALQWLLDQPRHKFRLGGTVVCFWARDSEEATDIFAELFEKPKPETVQRFLTSPLRGAEHSGIKPDEFYSVTLAGNAGRIVVRHWLQCPLESATENLKQWFRDLYIEPFGDPAASARAKRKDDAEGKEAPQPLALYSLAMTTVRESKDLQPELLTQLYRAALEGHAPSVILLKPILNRFAKELASDCPNRALRHLSRFALARLILNRNRKEGEPMIEAKVFETSDPAYNCGRLLAIFDDLQMRAHEYQLEGAGVVERYYGAASSAPNSAFGILWRLHQHHLKKLSRQGDKGKAAAEAIKRKIAEIAALFSQPEPNFPPEFPRAFSLVEQGRFALGFYQQKAADDAARRKAKPAGEDADESSGSAA
jgi:CRISPR-associated protein Csd1